MRQRTEFLTRQYEESVRESYEKDRRSQKKISHLIQRVSELETINSDTLLNLQSRDLKEKYEDRIECLTRDLAQMRKLNDEMSNELATAKSTRQDLQVQVAKLKLSERTLNIKLKQVTDQAAQRKCDRI